MMTERATGRRRAAAQAASPPSRRFAPAPRRVLVVDDSPGMRATLRGTLAGMPAVGAVLEAVDGLDALALLARESVDLIITDLTMPRLDGFKFLSAVRDNPRLRDVDGHHALLARRVGRQGPRAEHRRQRLRHQALRARASCRRASRSCSGCGTSRRSCSARRPRSSSANRELERLAHEDDLTGLPNRRLFFTRFEMELAPRAAHGSPLALLMIDIDHFKLFNDRHGHLAGTRRCAPSAPRCSRASASTTAPRATAARSSSAFCRRRRRPRPAGRRAPPRPVGRRGSTFPAPHGGAAAVGLTVSIGIASWPEVPPSGWRTSSPRPTAPSTWRSPAAATAASAAGRSTAGGAPARRCLTPPPSGARLT